MLKKILKGIALASGISLLIGCNNNGSGVKIGDKDIQKAMQLLSGHVINLDTGLTAKEFMDRSFEDVKYSYEIIDDNIEVTAYGYLKKMGKMGFVSYYVNLETGECEEGTFSGNVDWDYMME